jgi:hypothetical protein
LLGSYNVDTSLPVHRDVKIRRHVISSLGLGVDLAEPFDGVAIYFFDALSYQNLLKKERLQLI